MWREWGFCTVKQRQCVEQICTWNPPDLTWLKLNFDGSKESETMEAGAGFVIRNDIGRLLAAGSIYLQMNDVTIAELTRVMGRPVGHVLNLEGKLEFLSYLSLSLVSHWIGDRRLSSIHTNSSHAYCYECWAMSQLPIRAHTR